MEAPPVWQRIPEGDGERWGSCELAQGHAAAEKGELPKLMWLVVNVKTDRATLSFFCSALLVRANNKRPGTTPTQCSLPCSTVEA
jgi:hypothetical protein